MKKNLETKNSAETYKFDAIVIGAGIVGMAIAHELSKTYNNILVVEKETAFGRHVSSRNSEVIHSGLYYATGSLKARLCVEGNHLMYDFAQKYNINHSNCGKLIVIPNIEELHILCSFHLAGRNCSLHSSKKYKIASAEVNVMPGTNSVSCANSAGCTK